MKLWQAILIGCDRRAQAFGDLFQGHADGSYTSCALGAADEGRFGDMNLKAWVGDWYATLRLEESYPMLLNRSPGCPACQYHAYSNNHSRQRIVEETVQHLNDDHRWPREKIALEFVKPLEEAMEESCPE